MSSSLPLLQFQSDVLDIESPPLFTRIQIQTVSWCNRSCEFCPSGKFPVPKAYMAQAVFQRLIDQLHELDFSGRISPYLMNESLLDKRLPELIAYTRERCPKSWIALNSNGDALSETLLERLFDAGLNCLDINAYDNLVQYETYLALAARTTARRPDITLTTGYLDPMFNHAGETSRSTKVVHCRDLTDWETRFVSKIATPDMLNRAGNVPHARSLENPLELGCERPFLQMYINYLGQAVLCCNDWRFDVIMGDTAESTLLEIWTNERYHRYRQHLQRDSRALSLCATCDYRAEPSSWV